MGAMLLHVTDRADWEAAQRAGRLGAEPFLHLCTEAQLGFVLARHFAGRQGLMALEIAAEGLDIRWEESEPGLPAFPHLYGAAPLGAVKAVRDLLAPPRPA